MHSLFVVKSFDFNMCFLQIKLYLSTKKLLIPTRFDWDYIICTYMVLPKEKLVINIDNSEIGRLLQVSIHQVYANGNWFPF